MKEVAIATLVTLIIYVGIVWYRVRKTDKRDKELYQSDDVYSIKDFE